METPEFVEVFADFEAKRQKVCEDYLAELMMASRNLATCLSLQGDVDLAFKVYKEKEQEALEHYLRDMPKVYEEYKKEMDRLGL